MQNPRIEELAHRDPRYAPEAYQFVFDALDYATRRAGRRPAGTPPPSPAAGGGQGEDTAAGEEHVSVADFIRGARELALRDFGLLAPAVFRAWGVRVSDDLGEIVFNLIGAGLMDPAAADDRGAFHDACDLETGLVDGYRIDAGEEMGGPS